jgi:hypothetical protein
MGLNGVSRDMPERERGRVLLCFVQETSPACEQAKLQPQFQKQSRRNYLIIALKFWLVRHTQMEMQNTENMASTGIALLFTVL